MTRVMSGAPEKKIPSPENPLNRPPEKKGPPKVIPNREKPSDPDRDLPRITKDNSDGSEYLSGRMLF